MIDSQPGLGPQLLEGPGTSSAGQIGYLIEAYQSPILDLTRTWSGIEILPARPGFIAMPSQGGGWLIEAASGTQTTSITYRAGNNSTHDNFQPSNSNPNNANINAAVPPSIILTSTIPANTVKRFANLPVLLDVTVAAAGTGNFVLRGSLSIPVIWVPIDGAG